jgi:hypothetical protein
MDCPVEIWVQIIEYVGLETRLVIPRVSLFFREISYSYVVLNQYHKLHCNGEALEGDFNEDDKKEVGYSYSPILLVRLRCERWLEKFAKDLYSNDTIIPCGTKEDTEGIMRSVLTELDDKPGTYVCAGGAALNALQYTDKGYCKDVLTLPEYTSDFDIFWIQDKDEDIFSKLHTPDFFICLVSKVLPLDYRVHAIKVVHTRIVIKGVPLKEGSSREYVFDFVFPKYISSIEMLLSGFDMPLSMIGYSLDIGFFVNAAHKAYVERDICAIQCRILSERNARYRISKYALKTKQILGRSIAATTLLILYTEQGVSQEISKRSSLYIGRGWANHFNTYGYITKKCFKNTEHKSWEIGSDMEPINDVNLKRWKELLKETKEDDIKNIIETHAHTELIESGQIELGEYESMPRPIQDNKTCRVAVLAPMKNALKLVALGVHPKAIEDTSIGLRGDVRIKGVFTRNNSGKKMHYCAQRDDYAFDDTSIELHGDVRIKRVFTRNNSGKKMHYCIQNEDGKFHDWCEERDDHAFDDTDAARLGLDAKGEEEINFPNILYDIV